jgi:hypothetical protein
MQTPIPQVGFESRAPVFKRTETVHTSDSAAAVIGSYLADQRNPLNFNEHEDSVP